MSGYPDLRSIVGLEGAVGGGWSPEDQVLWLIILAVALLCVGMMGMAVLALCLHVSNGRAVARTRHLEATWKLRITAILSGSDRAPTLWRLVHRSDHLYFVDFLLGYARRLTGRHREILSHLARPFLHVVAKRAVAGDATQRARAIYTLGLLDFLAFKRLVLAALDDPSPLVVLAAGHALAQQNRPEYAEAVLSRLHRFPHLSLRYLASLLALIGPEVAPVLRGVLADPKRPLRLRLIAAAALRYLHDPASGGLLARLAPFERDREVLAALAKLASPEEGEPSPASLHCLEGAA